MSEPYIGELRLFPYSFAPTGWYYCNGNLLAIQANAALYAVIGIAYGGNGTSNFALPNLSGRVVVGVGDDPDDTFDPILGQFGGSSSVNLVMQNLPPHTHTLNEVFYPEARDTNVNQRNSTGF